MSVGMKESPELEHPITEGFLDYEHGRLIHTDNPYCLAGLLSKVKVILDLYAAQRHQCFTNLISFTYNYKLNFDRRGGIDVVNWTVDWEIQV